MWHFNKLNDPTALTYLVCHGSYGYLWLIKSIYFYDSTWEKEQSIPEFIITSLLLSLYWVLPTVMMYNNTSHPYWYLSICQAIFIAGVFFMFCR